MPGGLASRLLRNLTALAVIAAQILSPATLATTATASAQSSQPDQPSAHSLELNGTNAYAEVPNNASELNPSSDWTVELWFRDASPTGFNHPPAFLVIKGDTGHSAEDRRHTPRRHPDWLPDRWPEPARGQDSQRSDR